MFLLQHPHQSGVFNIIYFPLPLASIMPTLPHCCSDSCCSFSLMCIAYAPSRRWHKICSLALLLPSGSSNHAKQIRVKFTEATTLPSKPLLRIDIPSLVNTICQPYLPWAYKWCVCPSHGQLLQTHWHLWTKTSMVLTIQTMKLCSYLRCTHRCFNIPTSFLQWAIVYTFCW